MKCNKDEDVTAREIVEQKLTEKDIARAQKFALKAHNLFPDFDGISKFVKIINVYYSHQKKKKTTGEVDIHGILFGKGVLKVIFGAGRLLLSDITKRMTYDNKHGSSASRVKLLTPKEAMSALN
ncbi:uncharacterized protein [Solanum tuberosum]|uniref:uncharacterized protein n=1 Tax=Solanum tuberosum TaxID=4113 RepID=UPI00073A47DE|nr:PREDICTED: uncharacterized protein LOC107061372 [Solanum tuberosum]